MLAPGLFLRLKGVMNDASSLPENLRSLSSVRVIKDENKGTRFVMVEFLNEEDGFCKPPSTELSEKNFDFFLIQVVNTYRESKLIVKTGDKEKPKEVRVSNRGIQTCNIRNNGVVIRVSPWGDVGVYYVASPTKNNRKKLQQLTVFEGKLHFQNPHIFKLEIEDNEGLEKHIEDIKSAYEAIKKERFENKMDLSDIQYKLKKKQETEKIEETAPKEEIPEVEIPEEEPKEPKKEPKKEETPKKSKDEADSKAAKGRKADKTKDQEEAAEQEIEESKAQEDEKGSSQSKEEVDKAELEKVQKEAGKFKNTAISDALKDIKVPEEKKTPKKKSASTSKKK